MRVTAIVSFLALFAAAGVAATPANAQGVLGRLESDIRQGNDQPAAAPAPLAIPTPPAIPTPLATPAPSASPKVYLGAVALDEAGRGVRITEVRTGSPAQRAGLRPKDLVIGAAGNRVQTLQGLTSILGGLKPGDRMELNVLRGIRTVRLDVVLGAPSAVPHVAERPSIPAAPATAAEAPGTIPPPPTELAAPPSQPVAPPAAADGPALVAPHPVAPPPEAAQPVAPNSPQAQIEELRHRVDQLERRVHELEQALAEKKK